MSKPYLLPDLNDPTRTKIELRTDIPADALAELTSEQASEDPSWLKVEDIIDYETKEVIGKRAVVDEEKKSQALSQREAKQLEREEKEAKRLQDKQSRGVTLLEAYNNFQKLSGPQKDAVILELLKDYLIEHGQLEVEATSERTP